jgi:hypothetical protein
MTWRVNSLLYTHDNGPALLSRPGSLQALFYFSLNDVFVRPVRAAVRQNLIQFAHN